MPTVELKTENQLTGWKSHISISGILINADGNLKLNLYASRKLLSEFVKPLTVAQISL